MTMIKKLCLLACLSLAFAVPTSIVDLQSGLARAQSCLSNAEARMAVRSGEARPLAQVRRQALQRGGRIVNAQLCRSGGGLVYIISVLQPNGQVSNVTVNAR